MHQDAVADKREEAAAVSSAGSPTSAPIEGGSGGDAVGRHHRVGRLRPRRRQPVRESREQLCAGGSGRAAINQWGRSRDWKPWTGEAGTGSHGRAKPPPTCAPASPPSALPRVSRLRRFLVRVSVSERLPTAGDGKEREKDEKPAPGAGEAEAGPRGLTEWCSTSWRSPRPSSSGRRARCNCFNDINYEESGDEENFFLPSGLASAPHTAAANKTLESGLGYDAAVGKSRCDDLLLP